MEDWCYLQCEDALTDYGVLGYLQCLHMLSAILLPLSNVSCHGSRRHAFSYHAQDSAHKYSLVPLHTITNKKAVLPQGNRAMPQVFFSVEVRQQHSLQV